MESNKKSVSKTSIIRIMQIIERYSDKNHPLQHQEIADYLDKEFGIVMERKAIGYNVKLLAEMFAEDKSSTKVVTKRKLGTYITRRYMSDDDVAFLIDLVLSNYSINDEHRKRLCEQLRAMASISYRLQQPMPQDFGLVDANDSEDFVETKLLQRFDDIEDGIVGTIRQAIREKSLLSFDYSVQGEGAYHCTYLPIYLGIYYNRYYVYCFTQERKFVWIRLDYINEHAIAGKAIDVPKLEDFVRENVSAPPKTDYSDSTNKQSFVLVIDSEVKPELLVGEFGTAIDIHFDKKARLYVAKFVSGEDKVLEFANTYSDSVVVVEPDWCKTRDNRHRLISYYRRRNKNTDNG